MTATFKTKYGTWALVTGANAGIGKALSRDIASRGSQRRRRRTAPGAPRPDRHNPAGRNSVSRCGPSPQTSRRPAPYRTSTTPPRDLDIGLVVPNAGMEVSGEFLGTDYGRDQQMLALNVVVPAQMARVFGQRLARRAEGGILLVSSVVGYQGMPLMANYGATKAYIPEPGRGTQRRVGATGHRRHGALPRTHGHGHARRDALRLLQDAHDVHDTGGGGPHRHRRPGPQSDGDSRPQ